MLKLEIRTTQPTQVSAAPQAEAANQEELWATASATTYTAIEKTQKTKHKISAAFC